MKVPVYSAMWGTALSRTARSRAIRVLGAVLLAFCLACAQAIAQQQDQSAPETKPAQTKPDQSKPDIPDAPSASRPFPGAPPSSGSSPAPPRTNSAPPANQPPPESTDEPVYAPGVAPAPPFKVTTVPQGGATQEHSGGSDELYKISVNTNQVVVPVMVKDDSGRLVNGLLSRDFAVFEDGKKQTLNFFTTDPFALSAAVLFDVGMPDVAVQKVNQTFTALEGAFSQFDEVSLYTYSTSVSKVTDFAAVGRRLVAALDSLKMVSGRNNSLPVTSGPLGPQGPVINGMPVDPSVPRVITPPKESHVLNDALVAAAMDLSKRDRTRRKVIFVISDGRENGSSASYRDTLKVLLSHGIMVYGVSVEGSAVPVYGNLQKLHVPLLSSRVGYTDILPKYANATGGEIFTGFSRDAIETTYARALGDARNQYTLGYVTHATPSSAHREIEVRVARPDLKVSAKEGYYPVGLGR
ncbi:MAG TPA: VWA domain-containing protein [Terriglobales bacterium]|nr:VWA domain-containing protein [Terriglobales bacterium]